MPQPVITTSRSPRHDLPYLFAGQAQKEAFVNESLARLDALVQPIVIDERDAPPDDPAPGDCYIVGADPAGNWSGRAGMIASWAESQWLFAAPCDGMRVHDLAGSCSALFVAGEGWRRVAGPAAPVGGGVQDSEARAAIVAVTLALRSLGIFA